MFYLLKFTFLKSNGQATLNGSSLSVGEYLIRIYTDKGVFVEQLVIAK
jgi:roadblock/LC7 domain-containing protein